VQALGSDALGITIPLFTGSDAVQAITIPLFTGAIGYLTNWRGVWWGRSAGSGAGPRCVAASI
jgi:hypothetical protein